MFLLLITLTWTWVPVAWHRPPLVPDALVSAKRRLGVGARALGLVKAALPARVAAVARALPPRPSAVH